MKTATTFESCQILGTIVVFKHGLRSLCNHYIQKPSRWIKNSGCRLSTPGAFPALSNLIAKMISSVVKSLKRFLSIEGEFDAFLSRRFISLVNYLFGFLNLPLANKHNATAFGLMEFGFGEMLFPSVSLFRVDHVLRLDDFISTFSTVEI